MKCIRMLVIIICFFLNATVFASTVNERFLQRTEVQAFIDEMVSKHHFDRGYLIAIFNDVNFPEKVITTSNQPAEAMTWERYRKIFITDSKINDGVKFWHQYEKDLQRAEKEYGLPVEVIVATIGVESHYGSNTGKYRVIDSLTNLAFNYPRRETFFKSELTEYFLLTRDLKLDPLALMGSYAGAIGQPQFMPSSYRRYAVDFSGQHHVDLVNNQVDVIGSISNFYKQHGWQAGGPVATTAQVHGRHFGRIMDLPGHPKTPIGELKSYGVRPNGKYPADELTNLIALKINDSDEYWVTFDNFYVIKRYNPSTFYAMAVFQLSEELKRAYTTGG